MPRLRHRRRVVALVVGLVALACSSLTASSAAAVDERGPLPVPAMVRLGTFNINAGQSLAVWSAAITEFMPMVDVAGLQEVNTGTKTRWLQEVDGWDSYRPAELQQNPVMWDSSVFELIDGRGVKIANGRRVEVKKPGADSYEKDKYATVVRLRHLGNGQTISVVNVHPTAGGVNGGKRVPGRPKLYGLYVDELAGIAGAVAEERAWADGRVYVVGDFNDNYPEDRRYKKAPLAYAQMTRLGLVAAWETRGVLLAGQGSGTRGGAYLDNLWASDRALTITVKRTIRVSDHYPVVATYPVLPPVL